MKNIAAFFTLFLTLFLASQSGDAFMTRGNAIPVMAAGNLVPSSETPTRASMSNWGPVCYDGTWGAGCNVSTQQCIQPTSGTPYEPCTPPQMLFPTSGSAGSGSTTATINYTSYAGYAYPVGAPLNISGALTNGAAWNTPRGNQLVSATVTCATTACGTTTVTLTTAAANYFVGQTIYIAGITGTADTTGLSNDQRSFGWSTGGAASPNGQWTIATLSTTGGTSTITYTIPHAVCGTVSIITCTNTTVANSLGAFGNIAVSWTASASGCVGASCFVSFTVPSSGFSCTSSCVSQATQIVPGQTDDLILNWHFGPNVEYSVQNKTIQACVIGKHISSEALGLQYVAFAVNGGKFTLAPPINDPYGSGQSGLATNGVYAVYCAQVAASAVPDGLVEVKAVACPKVGICAKLDSTLAASNTDGTPYWVANNHSYQDWKYLAITNSIDPSFPNYNFNQNSGTVTAGLGNFISLSTGTAALSGGAGFTLTYAQPTNLAPPSVGSTVGVQALTTTGNSCPITAYSVNATTQVLTYTYTGSCSYPVGSSIAMSGLPSSSINGYTINGTATVVASTTNTASIYTLATGSATGLTGTINTNWNGPCVVSSSNTSAGNTTIGCTVPQNTAVASTGGRITQGGNLFCVVGGAGDVPTPYIPNLTGGVPTGDTTGTPNNQMNTDSFELIAYIPATTGASPTITTCTEGMNGTGCELNPCGRVPTLGASETIWLTRKDAGSGEFLGASIPSMLANGSLWLFANAGGSLKSSSVFVDAWNTGASSTCTSSIAINTAVPSSTPLPAFAGTPCADIYHAQRALIGTGSAFNSSGSAQVLTQAVVTGSFPDVGSTCLIFKNTNNVGAVPFYYNEPVDFIGLDTNTGAALAPYAYYWVAATGQGSPANGIALSATPGGPCINETPSNIFSGQSTPISSGASLIADLGLDNIVLQCGSGHTCTQANPETFLLGPTPVSSNPPFAIAQAGWLSIIPDLNNPNPHSVSVLAGAPNPFNFSNSIFGMGGRVHLAVDEIQSELPLTAVVPVGPTPDLTHVVSSSWIGAYTDINGVAYTNAVQLNYATPADGSLFQTITTTGSPGQGVMMTSFTTAAWDNATILTPTYVIASSSSPTPCTAPGGDSCIIVNVPGAASGDPSQTAGLVTPVTIALEFPKNTFPGTSIDSSGSGLCANATTFVSLGGGTPACVGALSSKALGTSAGSFPVMAYSQNLGNDTSLSRGSNCLPTSSGQNANSTSQITALGNASGGRDSVWKVHPSLSSGTHDVIEMTWTNSTANSIGAISFRAINQCDGSGFGPFYFANSPISFKGSTTDTWLDGITRVMNPQSTSPGWSTDFSGGGGQNGGDGTYFITNSHSNNIVGDGWGSGYLWGDLFENLTSSCANQSEEVVDVRCRNEGPTLIAPANGGSLPVGNAVTDSALPVTGVYDTTNATGTQSSCGGTPSCYNPLSTLSITFAPGTIPYTLIPGWSVKLVCGWDGTAPLLTTSTFVNNSSSFNGVTVQTYNMNTNPQILNYGLVPSGPSIGATCPLSTGLWAVFDNTQHIDEYFWQIGVISSFLYPPRTRSTQPNWGHWKDFISEQLVCNPCGNTEAIFIQGYNFFNVAIEDSVFNQTVYPIPGQFALQGFGFGDAADYMQNFIIRNTFISGPSGTGSSNPVPFISDLYMINDNQGSFNTVFPSAFAVLSSTTFGFWSGSANMLSPPSSTSSSNFDIFPTGTRATDPTTGLPTVAAQPDGSSLQVSPFYLPTGSGKFSNSGLGAM